jgi:hypothetical protein
VEEGVEAGGEEKGEGKKKRKKRSKKTTAAVEEDEEGGGKEEEGPSLIDIGSKETSPAPAAALAAKTESPRKKSPAREAKKQGELKSITKHMHVFFCLAPLRFHSTLKCEIGTGDEAMRGVHVYVTYKCCLGYALHLCG